MRQLALWMGVDRAIFFTVLTRGWNASAGLVTIFLVSHFLSPVLQGYYYTFYSLIALQVFAELGLTYSTVHFTSHETAKLSWSSDGIIIGNQKSKKRLQSLMLFVIKWLGTLSLVMAVLLSIIGLKFFSATAGLDVLEMGIAIPWLILVTCTVFNIVLAVLLAILEGSGRIVDVAILRLWQSVFAVVTFGLVLSLGGDLFALAASSFATALVGSILIWSNFRHFLKDIYSFKSDFPGMDWRSEIWPFQWRMAISSLSGFFIFQLFNPILFASHGPIAAGQMGMTMQIIGAMNGLAMAWINTKAPIYGKLIAEAQICALDRLFFRGLLQSLAVLIVCSAGLYFCLKFLTITSSPYIGRVLPEHLFVILILAGIFSHIVSSEAVYLRAHRSEPFMLLSVFQGGVTGFLAIFLIPKFGLSGAVFTYAIPIIFIGFFLGTIIFLKFRNNFATQSRNNDPK